MCISDISESLGNVPGKSMWDLPVTVIFVIRIGKVLSEYRVRLLVSLTS